MTSPARLLRYTLYVLVGIAGFVGFKALKKASKNILSVRDQNLDDYIKKFVNCGQFSGSVLVAQKGHILLSKGYGYSDVENKQLTTKATKYWLASCTKQFTAMAVMILMEKGLLDLHDKIAKFLPDYPRGDEITLHHLLTHSSGIPDCFNDPSLDVYAKRAKSMEQVITTFKNVPLKFTPGSQFNYSNSGYILLSAIIDHICKENKTIGVQSFDQFLKMYVFDPLEMHNTQFGNDHDDIHDRAKGYLIAGYSLQQPVTSTFIEHCVAMGDGTLYSTVEDLYKWDRALYSEKLVSYATLEKIFTPYLNNYGYGWEMNSKFGKVVVTHDGNSDSTFAHISRFIEDDVCIIVLSNYSNAPIGTLSSGLAAHVFGYEAEEPKEFVRYVPKNLAHVAGYYTGKDGSYLVTNDDEKLFLNEVGCIDTYELLPTTRDTFLDASNLDVEISFKKSHEGSVKKMMVSQDGFEVSAIKTI
jgi:CubicO group peptidase (beta-lactamase class C family)